jgi:hypothetical protein
MGASNNSMKAGVIRKFLKRMLNPSGHSELSFEYLLKKDAIRWAGFDAENNVPLYIFTEKIMDISPALYQEHRLEVHKLTLTLWEKGFIEADWLSEDPIIHLSNFSFEMERVNALSSPEKHLISELKRLIGSQDCLEVE